MIKLLEKIEKSFDILKLQEDWDEEGALKADLKIFNKAMIFIHLLSSKVENLSVPEINLCRDASIDFSFRCNKYRLLVNIKLDKASCYGDDGNNKDVIKTPDLKMDDITEWCRKYMTKL